MLIEFKYEQNKKFITRARKFYYEGSQLRKIELKPSLRVIKIF